MMATMMTTTDVAMTMLMLALCQTATTAIKTTHSAEIRMSGGLDHQLPLLSLR
jgi:hypothetical protein